MSRFRLALTGLALAAGLLIPVGIAQAAPSGASAAHQPTAARAGALTIKTATGTVRVVNAATASGSFNGCPHGDVCMYTSTGWANGTPEHKYFAYGCYNLNNELGTRVIANNQYGGATVSGYYNYGCTNQAWNYPPSQTYGYVVNITPINSISLNP